MIPLDYITDWRNHAPWPQLSQVEQDLIISRALIDLYNHPVVSENLAFRGGTALFKDVKRVFMVLFSVLCSLGLNLPLQYPQETAGYLNK